MSKIKLFCFPYAGGSSVVFRKWTQYADPAVEICPVELAGRGKRVHEPPNKDLDELVNDIYKQVIGEILYSPYALFGHSMGSLICYELAQKIRERGMPQPLHLFFSGAAAPHVKSDNQKKFHLMSEAEFRHEVIRLGGTPPDFFEHPDLMDYFLPLLKNDFKIAETDLHHRAVNPLPGPITVFMGKDDDITTEQCDGWKMHSVNTCTIHYFEGGHFFLNEKTPEVVKLISSVLKNQLKSSYDHTYAGKHPH